MASFLFFPYLVSLVCSLLTVPSQSHSINLSTNDGFSISLIHRDSPQSPFYNHSMTTYERRAAAARRSINRIHHLMSLSGATTTTPPENEIHPSDISTRIVPESGEYIATFYIGTPPTKVTAFIDTATQLNWVKGPPIYDPTKSSSYEQLKCLGPCPAVSTCDNTTNLCTYDLTYADRKTSTSGIISYESFGFDDPNGGGSMVGVSNLEFGYSTSVQGSFQPQNGTLALNREPLSLISQLKIKKFSHCFTKDNEVSGSVMYFGSKAVIENRKIPIEASMSSAYYVTMHGISVNDTRVQVPPGVFEFNNVTHTGGVVFDVSSTYTLLRQEAYYPFETEMLRQIKKQPLERGDIGSGLCFNGTYADLGDLPSVIYHFTGFDLYFMKESIYVEAGEGVLCLTIAPINLQFSVIGNLQMRNLWVGYDLENMQIALLPAVCSSQ